MDRKDTLETVDNFIVCVCERQRYRNNGQYKRDAALLNCNKKGTYARQINASLRR